MTFLKKMTQGLAFALSPTAYMLTKKAKEGKVKSTAKKIAKGFKKGFMAPIRAVQGKTPIPKTKKPAHHKTHPKKGKRKAAKKHTN